MCVVIMPIATISAMGIFLVLNPVITAADKYSNTNVIYKNLIKGENAAAIKPAPNQITSNVGGKYEIRSDVSGNFLAKNPL